MNLGSVGSMLGGSSGLASGIMAGASAFSSLGNTYMQWQNLQYQKDLQKKIFRREDDSIWRRVNDLKRSGLSPVLAAGTGASAGPAISTKAPQNDTIDKFMNLIQMKQNIAQSNAQIELANAQRDKASAEARYATHEADYYSKTGTVKGSQTIAKQIADALALYEKHIKPNIPKAGYDYPDGLKKMMEGLKAPGTQYGR